MTALKSFDLETTTFSKNKRKASPFGAGNHVVLGGWLGTEGEPVMQYHGRTPPPDGWLLPVLEGTKLLATFNGRFDVQHAVVGYPQNYAAWQQFVAGGGLLWDCQLAEYLLQGMFQQEHMLSLDEVSPRYGGELKHDEVKALWGAGVQTWDIDRDLLERYLGGGPDASGEWKPGDLQNTLTVARAQIKRAKDAGQLNSILLNMGALVASCEMEIQGMFVDRDMGLAIAADLEKDLARLGAGLQQYLPALPFKFSWSSPKQKSALIFGGHVKYASREYQGKDGTWFCPDRDGIQPDGWQQAYSQKDEKQPVLAADGSPAVFKSGKNAGEFKTKTVKVDDLTKPKTRACDAWYTFPRMTEPDPKWAGAEEGVWSTSSDVVEELGKRDIPFLKDMAQLQRVTKDLGTYYIRTDEDGKQTGMLTLVGDDGIIHHSINHVSTVTGRLSSSSPNLQNLPRGDKSRVKEMFRSRFGTDGVIVQDDFSSLEVYVQANLTGSKQLIADLRSGIDMHCMRLSKKEGIPYEEVLRLVRDPATKDEWKVKRTGVKAFSFQLAYGAGAAKISESTGLGLEEVERLMEIERQRYPEIDEFFEKEVRGGIKASRRPGSQFVPHPVAKQMAQLGRGYYRAPSGKLYGFTESLSPDFLARKGVLSSFSPTEIKNYPVQGEGGEWMKAAMWLAVRAFYSSGNFGGKGLLVNTVHDALYADAAKEVARDVAVTMHACMEAASDLIEWMFSWDVAVPVPAEIGWGPSMGEESGIKDIAADVAARRAQLRNEFMKGYTPTYLT